MENNKRDLGRWVDARMASLDAFADWQPTPPAPSRYCAAATGVAAYSAPDGSARRRDRMAAAIVLLALGGPRACANPMECGNDANQAAAPAKDRRLRNFKEIRLAHRDRELRDLFGLPMPLVRGSLCRSVPELTAEYVKTGKVKLVHRDFPLPQHQYSRLAARYANAAGRLGYYDAAVAQIFKTQAVWEKARHRRPAAHGGASARSDAKVREMVANDRLLDDTVTADSPWARETRSIRLPASVVVAKGKRQVIPGVPSMPLLKSYLDDVLK